MLKHKIRIAEIEKAVHIETGEYFLDVAFEIVQISGEKESDQESETIVSYQKHAFSVEITKEELTVEAKKILVGYVRDLKEGEKNREREENDKHVEELKETLVGEEISQK